MWCVGKLVLSELNQWADGVAHVVNGLVLYGRHVVLTRNPSPGPGPLSSGGSYTFVKPFAVISISKQSLKAVPLSSVMLAADTHASLQARTASARAFMAAIASARPAKRNSIV